MLMLSNEEMVYVVKLESENEFLKQRNKDLRQKTWYSVYEENLKLKEQLKQTAEIVDKFYLSNVELEKENQQLKGVVESVQTFINQFA
jgi:uncharacterized protein YcbX